MKIEQQPKFQPITLTLETAEEAEALWRLVRTGGDSEHVGRFARDVSIRISNWFSQHAQMGGME